MKCRRTMQDLNKPLVELVEENGNRVRKEDAIEELAGRYGGEDRAEDAIDAMVDDSDKLVTDRFEGHTHIEKVVY